MTPEIFSKKALWAATLLASMVTGLSHAQTQGLTGNMDADQLIQQIGVAAACALAGDMAQNSQNATLSGIAQGAMGAFCGLPMNGLMPQNGMMGMNSGVALAPINMNGFGGGMGAGLMPTTNPLGQMGMPGGLNPNMLAGLMGGQLSSEQLIGQAVGTAIGNALTGGGSQGGGLGGGLGGITSGLGGMPIGGLNTAGLSGALTGGGSTGINGIVQQVAGAAIGTVIQNSLGGGNAAGAGLGSVAGLPVVAGNAQAVYVPSYNTGFTAAAGQNLFIPAQGGIRPNAQFVLPTYTVNGQTYVDTRPLAEAVSTGGVRLASGIEASQVGLRLGGFADSVDNGGFQTVAASMASQVDATNAAYDQGFADGRNGLGINPLFIKDSNYKAGYEKGAAQAKSNSVV